MVSEINSQNLFSISRKKLQIADYLLNHAYPLCNDPKLLVRVVNILYQSYYMCLGAIFAIDDNQKTIISNFLGLIDKDIPSLSEVMDRDDLQKSVADISLTKKVIDPLIVREVFLVFKNNVAKKHIYESSIFESFAELENLVEFQKKSPISFARKQNYVICSEDYELKIINQSKLDKLSKSVKQFLFESKLIFKFD